MRFPIRFSKPNRSLAILGLRPANSWVDVGEDTLVVHMGWAFRLHAPLASIIGVAEDHGKVGGWGVHGWRGRWLVNGSSEGLVRVEFDPPGRAWMSGFRVTVRQLRVSVDDPDGLIAALGAVGSETR